MMVKFVVQPYHVCAVPVGKVFNRSRVVYGAATPDFVGWGFLAEHRIILISRFQGDRMSEIGKVIEQCIATYVPAIWTGRTVWKQSWGC